MRGQGVAGLLSAGLVAGAVFTAGAAWADPAPALVDPRALAPSDPLERFNRAMFAVDRQINKLIAGKTTLGSPKFVPNDVKAGVYNFFNNLGEPVTAANDVLQMKWKRAGVATARFATNTTVGLLGTKDVASRMGLERHREDFGQTLARWGAPAGPYVYLPLMGPTTVRDELAGKVDGFAHPLGWVEMDELPARAIDYTENAVQPKAVSIRTRARVAKESGETDDEYAYLRHLYYAQRAAEIQDTPEARRYIVPTTQAEPPPTVQARAPDRDPAIRAAWQADQDAADWNGGDGAD